MTVRSPRAWIRAALLLLLGIGAIWFPSMTRSQPAAAPESAAPAAPASSAPAESGEETTAPSSAGSSVWELIYASGWVGLAIILLSVAAVALVLENVAVIRRKGLIPPGLPEDLHAHITAGEFALAEQACKLRPSYLAYVVLAGLRETRMSYEAVERAMESASQEQASRLARRIEYLALIGNIAPMLGLLGTVYGILLAFKKVAESQGTAVAADLADGVYLALVTTVEGLVVAIPTLGAYAILRSRLEQFAGEINVLAERVFVNFKHGGHGRREASVRPLVDVDG